MAEPQDSGMAPIRRDAVSASDLIAVRELLKAEAQAIHQLAQGAIKSLDEKMVALIQALDEKVDALHETQASRIEEMGSAINQKLEALNKAGWERIKDADVGARERVQALQEQLQVTERLAVERLEGVRREILLMQKNAEEAISKAMAGTDRRFESVNEFRAQQGDLIKTFATKADVKAITETQTKDEDRIKVIEVWVGNIQGRMWAMGAIIIIFNLILRFFFQARGT
jgi:vacuolar-type H+-ATPase subunit I/STV1